MRAAVGPGRRGHADLLHPGNLGRNRGHQQGGNQGGLPARHADAHALDGGHLLSQDHPVAVLHEPRVAALALVERADIRRGLLEGQAQLRVHGGAGFLQDRRRNAKLLGGKGHIIELAGEGRHRLVAAAPHLLEHAGCRLLHLGRKAAVAPQNGLQLGGQGCGRVGDEVEHQ